MIIKKRIGNFSGQDVWEYTMANSHGMEVSILNYGGIVHRIIYPDKHGRKKNRILAYEAIALYEENPMFMGALIGRIAGRIANAGCRVPNGPILTLEKNEGTCNLHGGSRGFHHCFWQVMEQESESVDSLILKHVDEEHDGWPGDMHVCVTYALNDIDELRIHYQARTNKIGLCNMTNHMYFNLDGVDITPDISSHELQLAADGVQFVDASTIPTGDVARCDEEKIFDFRSLRKVGKYGMDAHPQQQLVHGGYDHAFCFSDKHRTGRLQSRKSGVRVDITTQEESVVVYTCNKVDRNIKLEYGPLTKHAGITLETQALPDRIHSYAPEKVLLTPEKPYESTTIFAFSNVRDSLRIPALFW